MLKFLNYLLEDNGNLKQENTKLKKQLDARHSKTYAEVIEELLNDKASLKKELKEVIQERDKLKMIVDACQCKTDADVKDENTILNQFC